MLCGCVALSGVAVLLYDCVDVLLFGPVALWVSNYVAVCLFGCVAF